MIKTIAITKPKPCNCEAYPFPHRFMSGECAKLHYALKAYLKQKETQYQYDTVAERDGLT
jgi:hypothetical protein